MNKIIDIYLTANQISSTHQSLEKCTELQTPNKSVLGTGLNSIAKHYCPLKNSRTYTPNIPLVILFAFLKYNIPTGFIPTNYCQILLNRLFI